MQDLTPLPRDQRPPLPEFTPVPRKSPRHDGWTPERQRAFIEALADTGSVSRACRLVNMATEGAYMLRRQPGAESFRRAWEAALDFGVQRLKDLAFERAIEGEMIPVFSAGKLMGYRRKRNDRLLMFCLRHYGQDAQGRRVTIDYFSTKAGATTTSSPERGGGRSGDEDHAGGMIPREAARQRVAAQPMVEGQLPLPHAGEGRGEGPSTSGTPTTLSLPPAPPAGPSLSPRGEGGQALAQTTTIRTTVSGPASPTRSRAAAQDEAAALLTAFEGVALDPQAQAEILAALTACAERQRTQTMLDDPAESFVPLAESGQFAGELHYHDREQEMDDLNDRSRRPHDGELPWTLLGDTEALAQIDQAYAATPAEPGPKPRRRKPVKAPKRELRGGIPTHPMLRGLDETGRAALLDKMVEEAKAEVVAMGKNERKRHRPK